MIIYLNFYFILKIYELQMKFYAYLMIVLRSEVDSNGNQTCLFGTFSNAKRCINLDVTVDSW